MQGTMAHEMDFTNHMEVIGRESGWDETIKEAMYARFLATRENADGLFDEFKDFLSEERAKEAELDGYNPISGVVDDEDEDDEEEDEEDDEELGDEDFDDEDDEDFDDDEDLDDDEDEDDEE